MQNDKVPPSAKDMSTRLAGNIARLVERRREEALDAPLGLRIAGHVTGAAGSMWFVLLHVVAYGGMLLTLTDLIRTPFDWQDGLGIIGSLASIEAMFLALFVLMNQRLETRNADRRADLDLHIGLLAEDELTQLAAVIHRIAEKLDIAVDRQEAAEVEKTVDPEEVLDALDDIDERPEERAADALGATRDAGGDHAKPALPAMKASTAS
ncbi:DUF1003 domain-containing protein [Paracoccus contaminans]|uniref:DUF1003 domain-containing protein n=1 Tax=Paracoccus contaminans TaxID=1945662 RepID=A0A1W6D0A2_9RHOB|nr:DUF1003 domain-containing protein [Paracoccus contaminans]ARJ70495.1 hypothetical protein B0A89_13495 [Paracoccus contaminans]